MISPGRASKYTSHPAAPLIAVAFVFALAQLAITTRVSLGWDETVYISQVSPHAPAAMFGPPRARGITLLPAPLVALTSSLVALRAYMAVISSAALVAAYWPWTRLLRPYTAGLAALLLASLWVVQFYGTEVMPNLYVAYGAVAAAGWFALTVRASRRGGGDGADREAAGRFGRTLRGLGLRVMPRRGGDGRAEPGRFSPAVWLAASLAVVTLMRPGDAAWLALPLFAGVALAGRRRVVLLVSIVAGLFAGGVEWVAEAYARFGDPVQRLHASSKTEGGLGWHPEGIRMELNALNDHLLCRPCAGATWHTSPQSLWWPLIPVLAAGGLAFALREGRTRLLLVPAACGGSLAVSYLLFVGYAAPRFLIPAYALLALPVAYLLSGVTAIGDRRWRIAATGFVAAGIAVLAVGEQVILARMVADQTAARRDYTVIAGHLRDLGIHPPCTLAGDQAQPLAFYAGCASTAAAGRDKSTTLAGFMAATRGPRFATLTSRAHRPGYATGWHAYAFTTPTGRHWRVYTP